ncbi:16S rRNA (guanine(527)-N(7))-methyltransferase RsmG [Hwanghaeella sp.]|uniref:16S rRNA (guanine(527)-N(7))-methyltransferase RsmG n=1 Tax=Hwanghaeella sp. TaxID=2605943 RepID=UPI003CCC3B4A
MSSYTLDDCVADLAVSRETAERFKVLAEHLVKWNERINLVSKTTLDDMWRRHFLDSGQLAHFIPPSAHSLADLGSGAGFPGLVLAAMTDLEIHLIESDTRKAVFLREGARAMKRPITVHQQRIESLQGLAVDVVTARALAPVEKLLEYAERLLKKDGIALFLKGNTLQTELTDSKKSWHIESTQSRSLSDSSGCILKVEAFRRVRDRK